MATTIALIWILLVIVYVKLYDIDLNVKRILRELEIIKEKNK